ncbi:unnamed protein product, partial [Rotaria sp. Silwood2]
TIETTTVTLSTSNCKDLEAELTRVKVGLGVGLGSGMAATTGLAVGTYIYFSRQLAQFTLPPSLGPEHFTRF